MKLKKIILLTVLNFLMCCGQEIKRTGNSTEVNTIIQQGFTPPNESIFKKRIEDVFGVDINTYKESLQKYSGNLPPEIDNNVKILIPRYGYISESEKQPEVHLNERVISWTDPEEDLMSEVFVNKYIFYKDKAAFSFLKAKKSGYLYYLLLDFGYEEDQELVDFILKELGKDAISEEKTTFANRIFIGSIGILGKYQLRKNLVKKYYNLFPDSNFMYDSLAENILNGNTKENGYDYEGDKDENAAFLLELQLDYAKEQLGTLIYEGVDDIFRKYPKFLKTLKTNKSYGYILLNEYVKSFYDFISFTIQDPDGFTNLRKEKNAQSEIIQKIKSGEHIDVLDNSGDWFLIKTKEGKEGYVHKSRIKEK